MKIYTDGGTKNNGGPNQNSRIAVWAKGQIVVEENIGNKTNNEAEYIALIKGLEWVLKNSPNKKGHKFYTDSQLMQKQISFQWNIGSERLQLLADQARMLLRCADATLFWIPRDKNKAGHYLEQKYSI